MDGWTPHTTTLLAQAYRTGWLGAWDALLAALKRDQRLQVPQKITLTYMVKGNAQAFISQAVCSAEDPNPSFTSKILDRG